MSRNFTYPEAHKDEVVDDYHGTPVPDPYRWLEDPGSEATHAWVTAQNALTADYISEIPARDEIHARLRGLWNYPKYSVPVRKEETYFYFYNDGLKNQPLLYKQYGLEGGRQLLVDPNEIDASGTTAIITVSPSDDAKLLGYSLAGQGSDWQQIRIRDVEALKDYDEVLRWVKFTPIAWLQDSSGFYYSRFPEPGTVEDDPQSQYNNKLYFHTLGTDQSEDQLIYEQPDARELNYAPSITDDGQYLVLNVFHGSINRNRVYYIDLEKGHEVIKLIDEATAEFTIIGNTGTLMYFVNNKDAPRGRIIGIDVTNPDEENWQVIVQESQDTLVMAKIVNEQFAVLYLHDAYNQIKIYDLDGTFQQDIPLPTMGAIQGISGKRDGKELFLDFTSYLYPPNIFRFDFETETLNPLHDIRLDFDFDAYETTQVFYTSKDGTRVPMFLTYRKGLQLNGQNPTLLYGYGGFSVAYVPQFGSWILNWIEMGGIMAVANLRGGSEYGEEWHAAGMLENKQNVYDDFIAAAEYLIKERYTSTPKLAIMGRSNGGLLVSVCMLQRPELFGSVICVVPVADMLRYHKFTSGRYWTVEYGNAETNPEHFEFMMAYSPLHNVKEGVTYPPMIITTADHDDRVVPMHSKKLAATLQAADSGQNPILLRLDMDSGHGLGKPTSKWIDEWSDILAFLVRTLRMDV